jgi:Asp-tRNA(Asn)/Glu-tRNA(Gln) amidotransferase B subunit
MEQESAKIVKKDGKLLLDWNPAGNPLLEIVSES